MFKSKYYLPAKARTKSYHNELQLETFTYDSNYDIFNNAVILPVRKVLCTEGTYINAGGVCDENFNFLAGYQFSEKIPGLSAFEYSRSYKPDNLNYIDETVIFSGFLYNHFGHFLTDSMVRMWYAAAGHDQNLKVVLLLNSIWSWKDWELDGSYHLKLLELIGIKKERILIVDRPTKFKSVIVPKQSVFWNDYRYNSEIIRYNSELLKIVYDTARKSVIPKNEKKIYLSRSGWNVPVLNETFFENFFVSHGFKLIRPEDLPLNEQIAYLAGANEIVCTFGTLSHLALFAKPGTKIICLLRTRGAIWGRQHLIDQIKQLDIVYVDPSFNFLPTVHYSPSNVFLLAPTSQWKLFLKHEYSIDENTNIYEYLNGSSIKFGDYFKQYLQTIGNKLFFERVYGLKFNHIAHLGSLFEELDPSNLDMLLKVIKRNDSPLFREKLFIYKSPGTNKPFTVKLLANGRIWPINFKQNFLESEKYWSFLNDRLYFLDDEHTPVVEFVAEIAGRKRANKAIYKGALLSKITETCSIEAYQPGLVRNWIIRHTIKYLVNKKRYKKFKRNPDEFFRDSKNALISNLGKYYIRGNSTVIFYARKQFQEYFDAHDMKQMVENLKKNMDEISLNYIENFMRLSKYWYESTCVGSQWTKYDIKKQKEFVEFTKTFSQPFPDIQKIEPYFFYTVYGLAELQNEVCSSIDGKIIIDECWIGVDSTFVFNRSFPNSEIHVYAPIQRSIDTINKFLAADNCNNRIVPINMGLGDEVKNGLMRYDGETNRINITTIDTEYVKTERAIGLIKINNIVSASNIVNGSAKIIARDKPVLAIAIHHCPNDFFELKDKIKSLNKDYRFMIRKYELSHPQESLVLISY